METIVRNKVKRTVYSQADLSYELRLDPRRINHICSRMEHAEQIGNKKMYELRPVIDAYVEQLLDNSGKSSTTVLNAKRRSEIARAEKLELGNKKEKGEYTPTIEIESAQSELLSILSRGLDGLSLRLKKKYPETPTKYIAAVDNLIAQIRNDTIDGINTLADEEEAENAEKYAQQQLLNEQRAEAEDMAADHDADEIMAEPQNQADLRVESRSSAPVDEFAGDW